MMMMMIPVAKELAGVAQARDTLRREGVGGGDTSRHRLQEASRREDPEGTLRTS